MKKNIFLSLVIIIFVLIYLTTNQKWSKTKYIEYNGLKLAISVDGINTFNLPDNNYYLIDYECNSGSVLTWDIQNGILISDNSYINDSCFLKFESSPLLYDLVSIGDYIEYTGIGDGINNCSITNQSSDNTCTNCNTCSGWNANQTATDIYNNYGYCNNESFKYYVYGWRVLYEADNSIYIVSAGSPECVSGFTDFDQSIELFNTTAKKYCNIQYLSGGMCDENTAHAFNSDDFYKFTSSYYGSSNGRYLYNINNIEESCHYMYSSMYCGYNNDMIDNGSFYWFASAAESSNYEPYWHARYRYISSTWASTYGIRPVLKLDSSIRVTGGLGTMDAPYEISERVVSG